MRIELKNEPYDQWAELSTHERTHAVPGRSGAAAVFTGTMRDRNEGQAVTGMFLEHYPGMTEKHLHRIAQEAMGRWPLDDLLLLHRVGEVLPGQTIVLVAVWSAHRGAAFEACRFLLEDLKHKTPFWKRETLEDGERWVEYNTPG